MVKIQPKTLFVGKKLISLPTCHSTNDIAAEIIQKEGLINGCVILTDYQTNGKGQRGNTWESTSKENLLMSLMIDCSFLAIENQFYLSMISALSIVSTFDDLGIKKSKIKWPNDLFINEKKVGGILIESSICNNKISSSIIGIGINVFQKHFSSHRATSVSNEFPESCNSTKQILEKICESFEAYFFELKNKNFNEIREEYLKRMLWFNQEKKFKDKNGVFFGRITGLNSNGFLEMSTLNDKKYYDVKEIEYLFND